MVANNLIEIYTLIFAWNMYGAIWDVLTGTGLALIPIVAVIFMTFREGFEKGSDAKHIVRAIEIRVVSLILVLMLCVLPFRGWSVSLATARYDIAVNDCNPPSNLKGDSMATGTKADATFSSLSGLTVYRPVAWSLVELTSSAITNTTIKSMQCANNYDFLLLRIANSRLQDSVLRNRLMDFYELCYKTAYHRFLENPPQPLPTNLSEVENVDWIGSTTLMNYTNEYMRHQDAFMMNMDKYGFTRQTVNRPQDSATESGAHPSCWEVWNGEAGYGLLGAKGLKELVLLDIPSDASGNLVEDWLGWGFTIFGQGAMANAEKEDLLVKAVIQAEAANLSSKTELNMSGQLDADRQWGKAFYDKFMSGVGMIGSLDELTQTSTIRQTMKIAGPIILAMIQMILILASPIVMVLGGYKASTFIALGVTYFGLEFINAIWATAYFMDNNLLAFYVSESGLFDNPMNSPILTMVTSISVVFLPMLWLSILAYAGSGMLRGMGAMGVGGGFAMGSMAKTKRLRDTNDRTPKKTDKDKK